MRILFHTVITGALLDGNRVIGAAAWSKEGPVELRARLTIDASGDADLVAMAGFEAFVGDDGRVQNPTMIFRLGGVDVGALPRRLRRATRSCRRPSPSCCAATTARLLPAALEDLAVPDHPARRAALQLHPRRRRRRPRAEHPLRPRLHRRRARGPPAGARVRALLPRPPRRLRELLTSSTPACRSACARRARRAASRRWPTPTSWPAASSPTASPARHGRSSCTPAPSRRSSWLLDDWYEVPYGCFVPVRGEGLLTAGPMPFGAARGGGLGARHGAVLLVRPRDRPCGGAVHRIRHRAAGAARAGGAGGARSHRRAPR